MTLLPSEPARQPADQPDMRVIPYAVAFTDADYALIERGFMPKEMEDKWAIRVVDGSIFLHRSWTGHLIYRVDLSFGDNGGSRVACAGCAEDVLASSSPACQAAPVTFLIDALLLGRATPFPMPPDVADPVPGLLQHAVAGTAFFEIEFAAASPPADRPLTPGGTRRSARRAIQRAARAWRRVSRS